MAEIIYKIQRKSDGLFSTGGMSPKFDKKGKIWKNRNGVSNHLNLISDRDTKEIYSDCEIITYHVLYHKINKPIQVEDWTVTDATKRRKELNDIRKEKFKEQRKLNELEQLRKRIEELENEK